MRNNFHGVWVAVVTPNVHGDVDNVLNNMMDKFKRSGIQGIFVLGTTGEGFLLTPQERKFYGERFVEIARDHGLDVMIHISHDHPAVVLELAEHAASLRPSAVVVTAPAHFRLDLHEVVNYFVTIAKAVDIPILLYDIPSVTGNPLTPHVLNEIFTSTNNTAGIKVSHVDVSMWEYLFHFAEKHKIALLVGVDTFCLAALTQGASGIVSGPANVFPELYVRLIRSVLERDIKQAQKCQQLINKLCNIVHHGVPLAFIKESVRILGYEVGPVRAPLRELSQQEKDVLHEEIITIAKDVAAICGTKEVRV